MSSLPREKYWTLAAMLTRAQVVQRRTSTRMKLVLIATRLEMVSSYKNRYFNGHASPISC
jgi:hypothetical protein